jgi:hypothetical protein
MKSNQYAKTDGRRIDPPFLTTSLYFPPSSTACHPVSVHPPARMQMTGFDDRLMESCFDRVLLKYRSPCVKDARGDKRRQKMENRPYRWILALIFSGAMASANAEATAQEKSPTEFRNRVNALFHAESGKPLVRAKKQPPLRPGSGNYTRAYSYSIVGFAARCFYLGEMLDEANAALVENAQHYLDNPKDIIDRDSFHWHADIVMRLIDMYGPEGKVNAGRLTAETEAACLKPIWIYVKTSAKYNKPDHATTKTWEFHSTENHHAMDFTTHWHFSKIARNKPEYRELNLDGGSTLEQHYCAWNEYIVVYCRERAKKGVCIEIMCPGYNTVWLKGFHNFRDFGEPEVRRSAEMLLDLYWAYWSQEQLHGVEGGGKTRVRNVNGFKHSTHGVPALGWYYFGIGTQDKDATTELNALLSDYQPPAMVAEIAHASRADGPYEIRQRAQGLGQQGTENAVMEDGVTPNKFRTDGGGIVRYSYCDPAFTIGTLMTEARPLKDWVHISAQSRWQGVVFGDSPGARIVPVVRPAGKARDVLNGHWSVQSKGSLITQKLKGHKAGGPMIVWISEEGIGEPVRDGDLVFVETKVAYAAIRVVGSEFELTKKEVSNPSIEGDIRIAPPGRTILPKDDFAPVILEVMAKKDFKTFDDFKTKVKAGKPEMKGTLFVYKTMYGDSITFDTSQKQTPTINAKPVDYSPPKVLESPFLNADYDNGVVTIQKGEQKKILDFTR